MTFKKKKIADVLNLSKTLQTCHTPDGIKKLQCSIDGESSTKQTPEEAQCFKDITTCSNFLLEILKEDFEEAR
jgi:hypothetical protein